MTAYYEHLENRILKAEAANLDMREKFQRIARLCHDSVDTYYTLKLIQKMVEETLRLNGQKDKP